MKKKCLACGVEKDTSAKEVYPYPDDGIIDHEPVQPLFEVHCQGADWRVATICHACFHKLEADMWISEVEWSGLKSVTPFEELPLLKSET